MRSVWITVLLVLLLVVSTSCERVQMTSEPDDEQSPSAQQTPSRTATGGTPTATSTTVPPTPVPSGSVLRIRAVPARQVVLWDAELPAEYVVTRFTLYQRTESQLWRYVGSIPVDGRIIADPSDPVRLYIGDHPPCFSDEEPVPFYRSRDGGESWQRIEDANNIRPIMVLPDDPGILIGSRCGLALSRDQGKTWTSHIPSSGFELTALSNTPIGLLGIFTSEEQISYLRRIDIDDPDDPVFEEALLSFWGPGAVHATQERIFVGEPAGVHFTDDGGRTWTFTREGLEDVVASVDPMEEEIPDRELREGIGIYAIHPHPDDSSRVFLGTVRGLYLSEDGGETWGRIPEVEDFEVRTLTFAMDGAILYVTTASEGVIMLHNP